MENGEKKLLRLLSSLKKRNNKKKIIDIKSLESKRFFLLCNWMSDQCKHKNKIRCLNHISIDNIFVT